MARPRKRPKKVGPGKTFHAPGLAELVWCKLTTVLPRETSESKAISIKIPVTFFTELGKTTMQLIWMHVKALPKQSQAERTLLEEP